MWIEGASIHVCWCRGATPLIQGDSTIFEVTLAPLHNPTPSPHGSDSMMRMISLNHDEESLQRIPTNPMECMSLPFVPCLFSFEVI